MARTFDGNNQYLTSGGITPLSTAPFTMAAWFYSTSDAATKGIMGFASSGGANQYFNLKAAGAVTGDPVSFNARDGSGNEVSAETTTGYTINTWHHACGVASATDSRAVYIDGGSVGTNTSDESPTVDEFEIGRGKQNTSIRYFAGDVAEAAIWDVALTTAEIAILALGYSPLFVRPQSLVFYVPLIRTQDFDRIGRLTLTPTNSPTVSPHPPKIKYPAPIIYFPVPAGAPPGGLSIPVAMHHYQQQRQSQ